MLVEESVIVDSDIAGLGRTGGGVGTVTNVGGGPIESVHGGVGPGIQNHPPSQWAHGQP